MKKEKKHFLTGYVEKAEGDDGVLEVAIATDSGIDRDGEKIDAKGIDFENFIKNPVLLWAHDYRAAPIGKVENIRRVGSRILFSPRFAVEESEKAKEIFNLFKSGFMNAFSIGFIPKEWKDEESDGKQIRTFTKTELLEISAVPVPANPRAVVLARSYFKNLDSDIAKQMEEAEKGLDLKRIVAYRDEGIVQNLDTEWKAEDEVKTVGDDFVNLRKMSAWYDSGESELTGSYKLLHHRASDIKAVWRGVATAMVALLGAGGGVNIPDDEKMGVYNHLSKHYKQFDKTPPEFKLIEAQVLKDVDLDIDTIIVANIISVDIKEIKEEIEQLKKQLAHSGKNKADVFDDLLKSPEFSKRVLQTIDITMGKALRHLNRS